MPFTYNQQIIDNAFSYESYRKSNDIALADPATDEAAQKMLPYIQVANTIMQQYDANSRVTDELQKTLENAPDATWLVITEAWCGDAAFIVPVFAAIEKSVPEKVKLRLVLRDSNLDLADAHLTDGGRAIPILIVLNDDLQKIAQWGPRPAELQRLMKGWKAEGLGLRELIPNVHAWYHSDSTQTIQQELISLVQSYS